MAIPFNDTTDKTGVIQEMESILFGDDYGSISGSTDRLDTAVRYANRALDEYVSLALSSDTRWQWDDTNQTTHAQATANLVDGQRDYPLDVDFLKILQVDILDKDGRWITLDPIDENDKKHQPLDEVYRVDGLPRYYDLKGGSMFLYPAPKAADVTLAQGLRAHHQRPGSYFENTDTTKSPGIPPIHDQYIPLKASYYWARNRQMDARETLKRDLIEFEQEIFEHYAKRDKADRPKITTKHVSAR